LLQAGNNQTQNPGRENLQIQKVVATVAIVLFGVKITAYLLTGSVSVLTDALESTANIAASLIGLFSLYVAAIPKDNNHPYGHGKAEFISAAVEGSLILMSGLIIIYKSIANYLYPEPISQLDVGIALVGAGALVNFITGRISIHYGRKNNSLALIASGKHLQSDTYSTLALIAGLLIILMTGLNWLDSVVAFVFAIVIMITGYRILRKSIAGIMDEADLVLLKKMIELINSHRRENWIDLHNLRVIKYGGQLHVDCHLTIPWYLNIHEGHNEIEELATLIRKEFGDSLELFVHSDGCLYYQCNICKKHDCPVRQQAFEKRLEWNMENVLSDKKHGNPLSEPTTSAI
jgi:cation diffusion facilitator family transporter